MSKPRFNAILGDGQADGLTVDAIPQGGTTRCGIQDINGYQYINIRQVIFLKR
jgi:hypothetical protein